MLLAEYKLPKLKSKGTPQTTMIREQGAVPLPAEETSSQFLESMMKANPLTAASKSGPKIEVLSSKTTAPKVVESEAEPEYKIVHQGTFKYENFTNDRMHLESSRPESLLVAISLPKIVHLFFEIQRNLNLH